MVGTATARTATGSSFFASSLLFFMCFLSVSVLTHFRSSFGQPDAGRRPGGTRRLRQVGVSTRKQSAIACAV